MSNQNLTHSAAPNPVALITGATSGIGLEMARQLAARHTDLVLVSRRIGELEKIARELRSEHPVAVHVIAADLGAPGVTSQVFDVVRKRNISVDWLINNAGVGIHGDHLDLDLTDMRKMLQLNILAVTDLCHLFGGEMRTRGAGKILNIASTAGYQPAPYFAAYGASKSFVLNFSEALAKELEDYGVTVSCLSPGPTNTAFFRDVDAQGVKIAHLEQRDDVTKVAAMGIELMLSGSLSKIVGLKNYLRVQSVRISPRSMVAAIAKRLMSATRANVMAHSDSA